MTTPLESVLVRVRSRYDDRGTKEAKRDTKNLQGHIARAGEASALLTNRFRTMAIAAGVAGGAMTKVFADVESAETDLMALTGENGQGFQALSEDVRGLATSLGLTEEETLTLASSATRAGIASEDLAGFIGIVQSAAVALGEDVEALALPLAKLRQAFRLNVDEMGDMASMMTLLQAKAAITFDELITAMNRSSTAANALGLSSHELASAITSVVETGVPAQRVGTNLNNILISLNKNADKLATHLGLTTSEFINLSQESPMFALLSVAQAFSEIRRSGDPEALRGFMSDLGLQGAFAIQIMEELGSNVGRVQELLALTNEEVEEAGFLTKFFGLRTETLAFRFQQLKSGLFGAARAIGQRLAPRVKSALGLVTRMTKAIEDSPVLQYAAAFTILGTAILGATGFLAFYIASQTIAFSVAADALPAMQALWAGLAARIQAATIAQSQFAATSPVTGLFAGTRVAAREGAMQSLKKGAGRLGIIGGALGGAGRHGLGKFVGLLRLGGRAAGKLALPLAAALGVVEALRNNLLGVNDTLKSLAKPWKEIFEGDSRDGLTATANLLKIVNRLLGYVAAGIIKVGASLARLPLTPLAKLIEGLMWLMGQLNRVLGPVAGFLGLGDGVTGDLPGVGPANGGGGGLGSNPSVPTGDPPPRLGTVDGPGNGGGGGSRGGGDVHLNFYGFSGDEEDARRFRRIAKEEINRTVAGVS